MLSRRAQMRSVPGVFHRTREVKLPLVAARTGLIPGRGLDYLDPGTQLPDRVDGTPRGVRYNERLIRRHCPVVGPTEGNCLARQRSVSLLA